MTAELRQTRATSADELCREAYAASGGPVTGVALVAVGGYGRGELAPRRRGDGVERDAVHLVGVGLVVVEREAEVDQAAVVRQGVGRGREQRRQAEPRHVHQRVEPSEDGRDIVDEGAANRRLPEIRRPGLRPAIESAHGSDHTLGLLTGPVAGNRNVGAAFGERGRHHPADSLRAGDENDAVVEIHQPSAPLRLRSCRSG